MSNRHLPRDRVLWLLGLIVVVVLAGFVSFYASSEPDGLERVAEDHAFAEQATDRASTEQGSTGLAQPGSPLSDYSVAGVEDERVAGGLAGVAGVAAVLVLTTGLTFVLRRRRTTHQPTSFDQAVRGPSSRP